MNKLQVSCAPVVGERMWGNVFGDKRFYDGMRIATTEVRTVEGSRVVTKSGTVYEVEVL